MPLCWKVQPPTIFFKWFLTICCPYFLPVHLSLLTFHCRNVFWPILLWGAGSMRPSMQPPSSISYCPHNKPLFANLSCNSTAQLLTKPSSGMSLQEEANFPPTVYTTLLLLLLRLACNRRHYSSHSRYTWILLRALTFSADSDSMTLPFGNCRCDILLGASPWDAASRNSPDYIPQDNQTHSALETSLEMMTTLQ